jgi:hypothetical protein
LHVVSQDINGNICVTVINLHIAKQFILADAPNNPATSYHPVAITKVTSTSAFRLNHLLVAGNTDSAVSYTLGSSHDSQSSNFTIVADSKVYKIGLIKSGSAVSGVVLQKTVGSVVGYTSYNVPRISHSIIQITPSKLF